MDLPRLEVGAWNLSLAVGVVVAGCGPKVPFDDTGGTDSIGDTDTSPTTDPTRPTTDPTDPTDPTAGECRYSSDCPFGYECIDGRCEYYYYCSTGGCCWDGCCYDDGGCWYYECYSHLECGPGGQCFGYYCDALPPVPECEGVPPTSLIPLPDLDAEPFGLTFFDADGDSAEDLAVAGVDGAQIVLGTGAVIDLAYSGTAQEVVAGDLDNDGLEDLVISVERSGLWFFHNLGSGTFTAGSSTGLLGSDRMAAGDFDDDGTLDLAAAMPEDGVFIYRDLLGVGQLMVIPAWYPTDVVSGQIDGVDGTDLVSADYNQVGVRFSGNSEYFDYFLWDSTPDGPVAITMGDIDGNGLADIAYLESTNEFTLLTRFWYDGGLDFDGPQHWVIPGEFFRIDHGNADGDPLGDLFMLGEYSLAVTRTDPGGNVSCVYHLPVGGHVLALGDFDADGLDEAAVSNGFELSLIDF